MNRGTPFTVCTLLLLTGCQTISPNDSANIDPKLFATLDSIAVAHGNALLCDVDTKEFHLNIRAFIEKNTTSEAEKNTATQYHQEALIKYGYIGFDQFRCAEYEANMISMNKKISE